MITFWYFFFPTGKMDKLSLWENAGVIPIKLISIYMSQIKVVLVIPFGLAKKTVFWITILILDTFITSKRIIFFIIFSTNFDHEIWSQILACCLFQVLRKVKKVTVYFQMEITIILETNLRNSLKILLFWLLGISQ